VSNGRKTSEEAISDFLEIFEIHHNTFNDYQKTEKVSVEEFEEFYRTLSASYEQD
jgi:hemerythrin superfamily protein